MEAEDKAMSVYERIVNAEGSNPQWLPDLVDELCRCDETGQYLCSGARYLHAIDAQSYAPLINVLTEAAIDRDREHRYIAQLLPTLWGEDFQLKADKLRLSDNNFRRIYKRIYPDH